MSSTWRSAIEGSPISALRVVLATGMLALLAITGTGCGGGSKPDVASQASPDDRAAVTTPTTADVHGRELCTTKVAVLNATAEAGAGRAVAAKLTENTGTADLEIAAGPIGNALDHHVGTSEVFYVPGENTNKKCAAAVAGLTGIDVVTTMRREISQVAQGAVVAVLVGEDLAREL
jgi:hypothetical protein